MITLPELVALLYRADWTRLSLLARLSWARDVELDRQFRQGAESDLHRRTQAVITRLTGLRDPDEPAPGDLEQELLVRVAPGGRFRVESVADGTVAAVGDGERRWAVIGDRALGRPGPGPGRAVHGLFTPQWLLAWYDLRVTGQAEAEGRAAHRVTATPRRVSGRWPTALTGWSGWTCWSTTRWASCCGASRCSAGRFLSGRSCTSWNLTRQGRPCSRCRRRCATSVRRIGSSRAGAPGRRPGRPRARRRRRWASRPGTFRATARGGRPATPSRSCRPTPGAARRPPRTGRPPEPDLAILLHRTGRTPPTFTADLHRWQDDEAYTDILQDYRGALPPWLDGILGPDALWDAVAEHSPEDRSEHQTARLRVALPGRYRIDYRTGNWHHRYAAIACDGTQTRKIFADRVAVSPATPLAPDIASLVDPAWLLSGWKLSAAGPARVACLPGLRVVAEPTHGRLAAMGFSLVEVIVDAELGILLQHTSFGGDRPAVRTELRDVRPAGDLDAAFGAGFGAGFGADAAPGLRVVADSGGLLADRDLPRPVRAAGGAAAIAGLGAAAGAVAITGWLDKHRSRRRPGA